MGSRNWKLLVGLGLATILIVGAVATAGAGHENVILYAQLDGRNEVATGATNRGMVGDPNGTGFAYVFGIDGDPTTLCYVLVVDKLDDVILAHIHKAPAGTNGGVVVDLSAPVDGDSADCVTEGEVGAMGIIFKGSQTAADVLANPDDYYVNVHTVEFPGGAIRGQLAPLD